MERREKLKKLLPLRSSPLPMAHARRRAARHCHRGHRPTGASAGAAAKADNTDTEPAMPQPITGAALSEYLLPEMLSLRLCAQRTRTRRRAERSGAERSGAERCARLTADALSQVWQPLTGEAGPSSATASSSTGASPPGTAAGKHVRRG